MITQGRSARRLHISLSFPKILYLVLIAALAFAGTRIVTAQSTSTDASTDLASFPSVEVALIAGPQLKAGSSLNPYSRFDSIAASRALVDARQYPSIPTNTLTGTVTASQGSKIVIGNGTRFTSQIDPAGPAPLFNGRLRIRDADGTTMRVVQVASIQSDSQLTLTASWGYSAVTGALADTDYYDEWEGWAHDATITRNYYDLALCLYEEYYRTGDVQYLQEARRVADSWWQAPFCKAGTERNSSQWLQPRAISLGGLMLRALDGRPEMWDWINQYQRHYWNEWVMNHISDSQLFGGARESGYLLLYATWLSRVLPDTFPLTAGGTATNGAALRAAYLSDVERAAVNYYARVQYSDGSWRWDDPWAQADDGGTLKGIMQPFMVGLLLEGMVAVHRVTTNANVKAVVQQAITRSCDNLYNITYRREEAVPDVPGKYWRSQWYYYYGGTSVHPNWFEHGGSDQGAALPNKAGTNGTDSVASARHMNSTLPQAFGYAYAITGDERYKHWGEDIMDSSFGMSDGVMGIADSPYSQPKAYTMNYRASGKFLAWRLGSQQNPSPSPTPTPTPKPGPASTGMVATAYSTASSLAASTSVTVDQINALTTSIEQAYATFNTESGSFSSASLINTDLLAALYFSRAAAALSAAGGPAVGVQNRLRIAAYRLGQANNLMQPGVAPPPVLSIADSLTVNPAPIIGPADTRSSASLAPVVAPASMGVILGDTTQSPLAAQTSYAAPNANGAWPYELAGVSVTVEGRAAPLFYVSPSRIDFCVPQGVTSNGAEVLVTAQDGTISRGTIALAQTAPALFSASAVGASASLSLNSAGLIAGPFDVMTQGNLGTDKRTRLMIFATGMSNGVADTDVSNDIRTTAGVIQNLSESVSVEARTSDGRIFWLPVEYAGRQGGLPGLDQINIILIPELRGTGNVELTLLVAQQRSNSVTVQIR